MSLAAKTTMLLVLVTSGGIVYEARADQPETEVACTEGTTTLLDYGNHAVCVIDDTVDLDRFEFDGTVGDIVRILVKSQSNILGNRVELVDPNNVVAGEWSCNVGFCVVPIPDLTLEKTGTYAMLVSDLGNNGSGEYLTQLERIPPVADPPDFPPAIPYDATESDTIDPETDHDFFVFQGAAGSRVRLTIKSEANGLGNDVELYDPDTVLLAQASCNTGFCVVPFPDQDLTVSGSHLIVVSDLGRNGTGSYTVSVQCLFGDCLDGSFRTTRQYRDTTALPDISGNSEPEAVALQLVRSGNAGMVLGSVAIVIKDSATDLALAQLLYFGDGWRPIGMVALPDLNGIVAVAVLAENESSGQMRLKIKDVQADVNMLTVNVFDAGFRPINISRIPDLNEDLVDDLAVLAIDRATGNVRERFVDPLTGAVLGVVSFRR